MSKTVTISSEEEFFKLVLSTKVLVADFYAEWCGPCKTIAPVFEQLAAQFSVPNEVAFVKINVDQHQGLTRSLKISGMPTFIIFSNGQNTRLIQGADPKALKEAVLTVMKSHGKGPGLDDSEISSAVWLGAPVPKGYQDITENVEVKGIEVLNCDNDVAPGRTLLANREPSGVSPPVEGEKPDWVESDADEQLMVYMPFSASLKIHSLQITSLPPKADGDEEVPMRPKTIKLYTNRSHIIGFDEADETEPAQEVTIAPEDWDAKTGTAKVELRFVKFQRVSSLVVYFVDGDGDGDKLRVDRIRLLGDSGEKREMGKLEKIGDLPGE